MWKEYKLGDVLTINYGRDHKSLHDGDIPVYGSGGIMRHVDRAIFDGPSILIPRKGSLNNIMYSTSPFWTVDTMFWTKINTDIVEPLFLYYSICKKNFASLNVGTAVPSLTIPLIEDVKIFIPNLGTQNRIVSILKSLDDKIEVNRKINSNLEEQAKALFKSWFIDFEPFKDSKFVDSELGMIPEGWEVKRLEEVGEVVGGGTPSKAKPQYYTHKGIHWITPKDLSISHAKFTSCGTDDITEEGYNNSSAKLMPKGTVLFSSRAPIGYISIALNDICTNQGFKSVVPTRLGTAYIYYYLLNHIKDIEAKASGSTFKEASGSLMKSLPIIVPTKDVSLSFENKLNPVFDYQANLEKESNSLSSLRDTFLPRLMSGEI